MFCGTPSYMSPDLVSKKEYNGPEADIWATGVVMYTILTGYLPFKGKDEKDLYRKILKGNYSTPLNKHGVPLSLEARTLLRQLL